MLKPKAGHIWVTAVHVPAQCVTITSVSVMEPYPQLMTLKMNPEVHCSLHTGRGVLQSHMRTHYKTQLSYKRIIIQPTWVAHIYYCIPCYACNL